MRFPSNWQDCAGFNVDKRCQSALKSINLTALNNVERKKQKHNKETGYLASLSQYVLVFFFPRFSLK
jgi:hypothetical protein